MRGEDIDAMALKWPEWVGYAGRVTSVCSIDPSGDEQHLIDRFWPDAEHNYIQRSGWDLGNPSDRTWDIVVVSNVFMASTDPELWFRNVLASCRFLFIQDGIRGKRGERQGELGDDGDEMRYSYPPEAQASLPTAYDMRKLGDRVVGFHHYPLDHKGAAVHFVACIRGDLEPVTRTTVEPQRKKKSAAGPRTP